MIHHSQNKAVPFGGAWTQQKLNILEKYLDAYTTALKKKPFKLMYIDAFAGTGKIAPDQENEYGEFSEFMDGSTARAINITDKPFDKLIFIEQDSDRSAKLTTLRATHSDRNIIIETAEANEFLSIRLCEDWRQWRGVLFLDPFGTQVKWQTIEIIASWQALDTWILFPASAIARMMPTSRLPDDIMPAWASRLTDVYGDESWRQLYQDDPQRNLFNEPSQIRDKGVQGLSNIYKNKLRDLFGNRFLEQSRTLKNSRNSTFFEFLFCVGNPKGIRPAKQIAKHILEHL